MNKTIVIFVLACASSGCLADDDLCIAAATLADTCGMPLTHAQCKTFEKNDQQRLESALEQMNCGETSSQDPPNKETCRLAGWPCPAAIGPAPSSAVPVNQIVFVSGIASQETFDWNPAVLGHVADVTGAKIVHATLPSWATTNERAAALWSTLLEHGADTGAKFDLICYAVGGLDCRTLASPKGLYSNDGTTFARVNKAVASVTTISTPHRGTRVADAAVLALETGNNSDLVRSVTGLKVSQTIVSGALLDNLRSITLAAASARSAILSDGPGTYYQSFAGVSHVNGDPNNPSADLVNAACVLGDGTISIMGGSGTIDPMQAALWTTAPLGGASMDNSGNIHVAPTDGMVSVESAKWGTFRGCIPADHYHVIGQVRRPSRDVMTGFDTGRFYAWLVTDLAEKGY